MKFKEYPQGNLEFKLVKADYYIANNFQPKFEFNNNHYSSEKFAIEFFKPQGFNAFFSENGVWTKLLIDLFYKELKRSPNHNPSLSNLYNYLYDDDFFRDNETKIINRFNYLKTVKLVDEIKNNCPKVDSKIITLCSHFENNQILKVLFDLITNLNIKKRGFPDLFVYNDDNAFFCEVKGNSDSLSYVQVKKHEVLLNAGIDIVIFGINKNKSWVKEQEKKYFNKELVRRTNFIDNYDLKIYIADKVYNQLIDYDIENFKQNFIKEYDLDTFIGFLNIIDEFSFDDKINALASPSDELIRISIKKGNKLKQLKILKDAKVLEDKKKYLEAIELYSKVDTFKSYKRIIYCYRSLKDYENELKFIYNGINDSNFSKKDKRFFKNRLRRFFKNKNDYEIIKTNKICPFCGDTIVLNKFKARNNIMFFTCANEKCYWYGGVYEGNYDDFIE